MRYSFALKHQTKLRDDLNHCLAILHSLHIAYKNVKPCNVLYSSHLDRFILCDFETSEYVEEDIGGVSRLHNVVGLDNVQPETKKLLTNSTAKANLFYNDVYECKTFPNELMK